MICAALGTVALTCRWVWWCWSHCRDSPAPSAPLMSYSGIRGWSGGHGVINMSIMARGILLHHCICDCIWRKVTKTDWARVMLFMVRCSFPCHSTKTWTLPQNKREWSCYKAVLFTVLRTNCDVLPALCCSPELLFLLGNQSSSCSFRLCTF